MSAIATTAPKHLWQAVRDFLVTFFTFVGHPADLARRATLTAKSHAHLIAWLRAGEHFLRRLLLIEAIALGVPDPLGKRSTSTATRTSFIFDAANPETWRASFHCAAPMDRRRLAGTRQHDAPSPEIFPAIPLALRYEAILRAFNNPLPYARRLARILARQPSRAAQLRVRPHQCKRKSGDPAPSVDMIGRKTWDDLEAATPAPNSS